MQHKKQINCFKSENEWKNWMCSVKEGHRFPILFNKYFHQTVMSWIKLQCSKNIYIENIGELVHALNLTLTWYIFAQGEREKLRKSLKDRMDLWNIVESSLQMRKLAHKIVCLPIRLMSLMSFEKHWDLENL